MSSKCGAGRGGEEWRCREVWVPWSWRTSAGEGHLPHFLGLFFSNTINKLLFGHETEPRAGNSVEAGLPDFPPQGILLQPVIGDKSPSDQSKRLEVANGCTVTQWCHSGSQRCVKCGHRSQMPFQSCQNLGSSEHLFLLESRDSLHWSSQRTKRNPDVLHVSSDVI